MAVTVDWTSFKLTDSDGHVHELFHHEYWYLAPCKAKPLDRFDNNWQGFGIMLHNARIGEGLVLAQDDLLRGIAPRVPNRGLHGKQAEELLEKIRQASFPFRPSRLRCHFLFLQRNHAEAAQKEWGDFQERRLVRCFLLLSGGRYHYANFRLYEQLACGDLANELATQYWEEFQEAKFPLEDIEVIADSCLYFPDWQQFPLLDSNVLAEWNES